MMIFRSKQVKKLMPDDRVAATHAEVERTFDKLIVIDKLLLVTATPTAGTNFHALHDRAGIQYFDCYHTFTCINSSNIRKKKRDVRRKEK